jgi:hypothetical protein
VDCGLAVEVAGAVCAAASGVDARIRTTVNGNSEEWRTRRGRRIRTAEYNPGVNALDAIVGQAQRLDARLLAVPRRMQYLIIGLTVALMVAISLPHVPRPWLDYAGVPILHRIDQADTFGPDTIGDGYEARVVLNDPADMYTKRKLEQTPDEATHWSKEESAPYPPAVLLSEAALYAIGERTGLRFYGTILALACLFIALSIVYFVQTRWYLFPVLYLNFSYFSYRFVHVQDNTYLIMLVVVMAALFFARAGREAAHALMAVAIAMKLSPLYYLRHLVGMKRSSAVLVVAIVAAGLVLPYFIWENYLYIYQFGNENKGDRWYDLAGALALAGPFTVLLWYVETRLRFDAEDRIGWSLVPLAIFFAVKMNAARHLMIVLLVPDKRGIRTLAAAAGLALHALFPGVIRFNSVMYIAIALMIAGLCLALRRIGWREVREDVRHPWRTARLMLAAR